MDARDFVKGAGDGASSGEAAQPQPEGVASGGAKLTLPPLKLIAQTVAARASEAARPERRQAIRQGLVDTHAKVIDDLQLEEAWAQFGLPVDLPPGKRLLLGFGIILGTSVAAVVGEAIALRRQKGGDSAQPDGGRGPGAAGGTGQQAQPGGFAAHDPTRGN